MSTPLSPTHKSLKNYTISIRLFIRHVKKRVGYVDLDVYVEMLLTDFEKFVDTDRQTSEQFLYWENFLRLLQLLRNLIRSDRTRSMGTTSGYNAETSMSICNV